MHGAKSDGVIELHFLSVTARFFTKLLVDAGFDGVHGVLAGGAGPLEIEAQTVRSVFGTTLGGLTKFLTQRLVHHVGGGVGTCNGSTALEIDVRVDFGAHNQRAFGQTALVDDKVLDRLVPSSTSSTARIVGQNLALIGELAAGLRVEGRAVEDDLDVGRAGRRERNPCPPA